MSRIILIALSLLVASCASMPPRELVVRAGRFIDGTGAPAREGIRLRIRDGTIVAVERDVEPFEAGDDVAVIDARDLTVLPGLVNSHAHLFTAGACTAKIGAGVSQAVRNMHALTRGGITTVADLGAPAALAVALRRHVGTARHRGPRVMVAGPVITAPGGYPTDFLGRESVELGMVIEVATVDEARAAVRRVAIADADLIKVGLQEIGYDEKPLPLLEGEVLCAVVDEAHKQEMRVVAHATTQRSYTAALDCHVDAIMHSAFEPLDDALIARIVATKTPVAPTLFVFDAMVWGPKNLDMLDRPDMRAVLPDDAIEDLRDYATEFGQGAETLPGHLMEGINRKRAESIVGIMRDNTRRMHEAGVLLGLGTDAASCFDIHGTPVEELVRLEQAGLTRLEVLEFATSGGARILNLHDALGRLAVGFRADLIGVKGKPDENLRDIVNVKFVMIDGVVQQDGPRTGEQIAAAFSIGWAWLTD